MQGLATQLDSAQSERALLSTCNVCVRALRQVAGLLERTASICDTFEARAAEVEARLEFLQQHTSTLTPALEGLKSAGSRDFKPGQGLKPSATGDAGSLLGPEGEETLVRAAESICAREPPLPPLGAGGAASVSSEVLALLTQQGSKLRAGKAASVRQQGAHLPQHAGESQLPPHAPYVAPQAGRGDDMWARGAWNLPGAAEGAGLSRPTTAATEAADGAALGTYDMTSLARPSSADASTLGDFSVASSQPPSPHHTQVICNSLYNCDDITLFPALPQSSMPHQSTPSLEPSPGGNALHMHASATTLAQPPPATSLSDARDDVQTTAGKQTTPSARRSFIPPSFQLPSASGTDGDAIATLAAVSHRVAAILQGDTDEEEMYRLASALDTDSTLHEADESEPHASHAHTDACSDQLQPSQVEAADAGGQASHPPAPQQPSADFESAPEAITSAFHATSALHHAPSEAQPAAHALLPTLPRHSAPRTIITPAQSPLDEGRTKEQAEISQAAGAFLGTLPDAPAASPQLPSAGLMGRPPHSPPRSSQDVHSTPEGGMSPPQASTPTPSPAQCIDAGLTGSQERMSEAPVQWSPAQYSAGSEQGSLADDGSGSWPESPPKLPHSSRKQLTPATAGPATSSQQQHPPLNYSNAAAGSWSPASVPAPASPSSAPPVRNDSPTDLASPNKDASAFFKQNRSTGAPARADRDADLLNPSCNPHTRAAAYAEHGEASQSAAHESAPASVANSAPGDAESVLQSDPPQAQDAAEGSDTVMTHDSINRLPTKHRPVPSPMGPHDIQVWMIAIPTDLQSPGPQEPDTPRTVIIHSEMGTMKGGNDWMNLREARRRHESFSSTLPSPQDPSAVHAWQPHATSGPEPSASSTAPYSFVAAPPSRGHAAATGPLGRYMDSSPQHAPVMHRSAVPPSASVSGHAERYMPFRAHLERYNSSQPTAHPTQPAGQQYTATSQPPPKAAQPAATLQRAASGKALPEGFGRSQPVQGHDASLSSSPSSGRIAAHRSEPRFMRKNTLFDGAPLGAHIAYLGRSPAPSHDAVSAYQQHVQARPPTPTHHPQSTSNPPTPAPNLPPHEDPLPASLQPHNKTPRTSPTPSHASSASSFQGPTPSAAHRHTSRPGTPPLQPSPRGVNFVPSHMRAPSLPSHLKGLARRVASPSLLEQEDDVPDGAVQRRSLPNAVPEALPVASHARAALAALQSSPSHNAPLAEADISAEREAGHVTEDVRSSSSSGDFYDPEPADPWPGADPEQESQDSDWPCIEPLASTEGLPPQRQVEGEAAADQGAHVQPHHYPPADSPSPSSPTPQEVPTQSSHPLPAPTAPQQPPTRHHRPLSALWSAQQPRESRSDAASSSVPSDSSSQARSLREPQRTHQGYPPPAQQAPTLEASIPAPASTAGFAEEGTGKLADGQQGAMRRPEKVLATPPTHHALPHGPPQAPTSPSPSKPHTAAMPSPPGASQTTHLPQAPAPRPPPAPPRPQSRVSAASSSAIPSTPPPPPQGSCPPRAPPPPPLPPGHPTDARNAAKAAPSPSAPRPPPPPPAPGKALVPPVKPMERGNPIPPGQEGGKGATSSPGGLRQVTAADLAKGMANLKRATAPNGSRPSPAPQKGPQANLRDQLMAEIRAKAFQLSKPQAHSTAQPQQGGQEPQIRAEKPQEAKLSGMNLMLANAESMRNRFYAESTNAGSEDESEWDA